MPRSEAQIRADKKYREKVKRLVIDLRDDDFNEINDVKNKYNLTNKQLIRIAVDDIRLEREIRPYARKAYAEAKTFREVRALSGLTQAKFSDLFHIPKRTIEDWDSGKRAIAPYQLDMIKYILINEGIVAPIDKTERGE